MPNVLRVRDYRARAVQYTVVAPCIVIIFYHNALVFVKYCRNISEKVFAINVSYAVIRTTYYLVIGVVIVYMACANQPISAIIIVAFAAFLDSSAPRIVSEI